MGIRCDRELSVGNPGSGNLLVFDNATANAGSHAACPGGAMLRLLRAHGIEFDER